MLKPYDISDLEDILFQIRTKIMEYKKGKHEMKPLDVQDIRDELAILRTQLADIGAELYSDKVDTSAAYENARYKLEGEREEEYRKSKTPNAADRAKREARLETSMEAMNKADKLNRLAMNLYSYSLQELLNSMASRIAILLKTDGVQSKSAKEIGHEAPDQFDEMMNTLAAERDLNTMEKIIHE